MSSGDHIRVRRAAALTFAIASTLAGARAGYAQTPSNTSKDTQVIDIVIVTAQRREENLIDVPIAVAEVQVRPVAWPHGPPPVP